MAIFAIGCGDASSPATEADAQVSADATEADSETVGLGELDALTPADVDSTAEEDSAELSDAQGVFPSDLPIITEISEDVDLSEYFPDSVGPDADVADEPIDDTMTDAANQAPDVADGDDSAGDDGSADDASPDALTEPDTFLADCENLGVAPQWEGVFEGAIEYHIPEALEELFSPPDGILIVGGSLAFDIECVDSKLIVSGDMAGTANVAGEGDFPFTITLAGYFNPETGLLNANLVDGMVVLYGLAEIYFSGDFIGTLTEDTFDGTWTGTYNGTNFPLPPGDVPDADGFGTWSAQAAEVD
jgi:hypothetical protein